VGRLRHPAGRGPSQQMRRRYRACCRRPSAHRRGELCDEPFHLAAIPAFGAVNNPQTDEPGGGVRHRCRHHYDVLPPAPRARMFRRRRRTPGVSPTVESPSRAASIERVFLLRGRTSSDASSACRAGKLPIRTHTGSRLQRTSRMSVARGREATKARQARRFSWRGRLPSLDMPSQTRGVRGVAGRRIGGPERTPIGGPSLALTLSRRANPSLESP
jgi:hypothetical protein